MPYASQLRTSANQANAKQINGLIWDNCHIPVCELDKIMGISVSSVETIINDELNFSTISTH
jgi:hypothetical protein